MTTSEGRSETPSTRGWRRRRTVVAVAVAAALALGLGVGVALWRDRGLPEDAVFKLDTTVYLEADLRNYLGEQKALYGLRMADLSSDEERRAAAQSFAVSLVIDAAAGDTGVEVAPAELERAAEEFLDAAYPGGRGQFIDALADEGVSEQDVLDELRRQLTIERLYARVTADLTIDSSEVRDAYDRNREDFVVPERRSLAAIALSSRAEANALKGQLTSANFATIARRRSLDLSTAADGGDLGFISADELQGPFAKLAFRSGAGQVFGPVAAAGADYVYLGLVRAVRPERRQSFREVRGELEATLLAARGLAVWQSYLADRVAEAQLTFASRYRPEDPTSLPSFHLPEAASSSGSSDPPGDGR